MRMPRSGRFWVRDFAGDQVADAIETIVETYLTLRGDEETFIETYRRVGAKPFKEALYETA